ncbi:hypothetical protein KKF91_18300 [Myxococcota bacterium]|nr:hypothetical protein [Myxococcota bacterium]MBU1432495.1 hypothetical protein [Myxococcota bacterium]MBU1896349.1 hypothetical protein [Myxococcota bacterium]
MERRRERSAQRAMAAQLYLKALAGRRDYQAVALADQDGLLLANIGELERGEALAAIAPLWRENEGVRARFEGQLRGDYRAWSLDLDGTPCFLATVGGDAEPPTEASVALARILLAA